MKLKTTVAVLGMSVIALTGCIKSAQIVPYYGCDGTKANVKLFVGATTDNGGDWQIRGTSPGFEKDAYYWQDSGTSDETGTYTMPSFEENRSVWVDVEDRNRDAKRTSYSLKNPCN